jgi:hypothetical protein
MSEWTRDPAGARLYAQTHSPKSYPLPHPPHWLRCEFMRDGVRCVKGDGHAGNDHEEPK